MARKVKMFVEGEKGLAGVQEEAREWAAQQKADKLLSSSWSTVSSKKLDPKAKSIGYKRCLNIVYDG